MIKVILLLLIVALVGCSSEDEQQPSSLNPGPVHGGQALIAYYGDTEITSSNQNEFLLKGSCIGDGVIISGSLPLFIACENDMWEETIDLSWIPNGHWNFAISTGDQIDPLIVTISKNTIDTDALAFYQFSSTDNVGSDNNGAHPATTVGNVSVTSDIERGNVASFENDSSFVLNDGNYLNQEFSQRSVAFYFKPAGVDVEQVLYDEGGSTNAITLKIRDGELLLATRSGGEQGEVVISLPFSADKADLWSFVYFSFDNGELLLQLNDQRTTATAPYRSIPTHSDHGGVAANYGSNGFGDRESLNFVGQLDDLYIFDKVLQNSEIDLIQGLSQHGEILNHLDIALAAKYRFNDILDLGLDSSGNDHHSNLVENVTAYSASVRGDVGAFSTDSSYKLSDGSFLNDEFSSRTVMFWFHPIDLFSDQILYDEGGSTNGLSIRIHDGYLFAAIRSGGESTQKDLILDLKQGAGLWYHIAVTFNKGEFSLYLNGERKISRRSDYSIVVAHSDEGGIGALHGSSDSSGSNSYESFNGYIDEFSIYTRALFPLEILKVSEL